MRPRSPRKFALISTLLLFVSLPLLPASAGPAQDRIDALITDLRGVMSEGDQLGFQGRFDALEKPVVDTFDFATISRVGLARHWAEISESDKQRIVEAVTHLSVANFAGRFKNDVGIRLEVLPEQPGPRGLALVPTLIHRPNEEPINLTYVLRAADGGSPAVIDILAQGRYSELARQRAEFSAIFAKGGAEGVIEALEQKAREMAAQ